MGKIRVTVPDELLAAIDAAAESLSTNRGELIREAIRRYLGEDTTLRRHAAIEHLRRALGRGRWRAEELVRGQRDRER